MLNKMMMIMKEQVALRVTKYKTIAKTNSVFDKEMELEKHVLIEYGAPNKI